MNDNKTNALTITPDDEEMSDQKRRGLFKGTVFDYVRLRAKKHRTKYADVKQADHLQKLADDTEKTFIAALNEASALRAEVEGYLELFNQADVGSEFYLKDHLGNIEKCDDGKWRTQMATMQYGNDARWEYVQEGWDSPLAAYAAIKPNAGEEGTE